MLLSRFLTAPTRRRSPTRPAERWLSRPGMGERGQTPPEGRSQRGAPDHRGVGRHSRAQLHGVSGIGHRTNTAKERTAFLAPLPHR